VTAPVSVSAVERIYRARRVGATFTRVYLGARAHRFIARRLDPPDMPDRWSRFHRASADSIYDAAVELRGLILKGCQFLGSRADVLPREYVSVLSRLQDRVPPRPFPVVRRSVEHELGRPLEEVFAAFARRPVASASLAQVHEARLRSGERVAVKVQYPEIEALVHGDLSNLRFLFRAVDFLERDFDLMPLVEELGTLVPLELDFRNEARNALAVARAFAHRDDVMVPRIHPEHSTRRVLVMEYMEGIKISDAEALRAAGVDADRVVRILVEAWCEQVFRHGFFHADPHPGNLLVQPGPGGPRLVLLDFGLAKDLPPRFREGVVEVAGALLRGDADAMARALLALGFETRDGRPESMAEIARFVLDAAVRFRERAHMDREMLDHLAREIPDHIRRNPVVRMPGHVVLLGRTLGLLSGVSGSLGARLDVLATLLPYAVARGRS